ncbi:MAG: hypothetical protein ACR2PX_23025 [Endozoicomonas sp.]|uniref:hypothetical protein n=1 Tax=Endozoicomonas sp. TaxID=1892382 RepID=UPI003D9B9EE7
MKRVLLFAALCLSGFSVAKAASIGNGGNSTRSDVEVTTGSMPCEGILGSHLGAEGYLVGVVPYKGTVFFASLDNGGVDPEHKDTLKLSSGSLTSFSLWNVGGSVQASEFSEDQFKLTSLMLRTLHRLKFLER